VPSLRALGWGLVEVGTVSTAFPIIESLLPADSIPAVIGLVDVALGAVLVVLAFLVETRAGPRVTVAHRASAYRLIRPASASLLALLVVFFLTPASVNWAVLLVGVAWRAWLAIWVLPSLLVAIDRGGSGA
jgi:hypothetical protein